MECRRVLRGQPIDHGQARLDGGASCEDRASDGGTEDDAPTFLQPDEGIAPDRIFRRTTRPVIATSRPPSREPRKADAMCRQGSIGHAAIDVGKWPRMAGSLARRLA